MMTTDPQSREQLRLSVLRYLDRASGRFLYESLIRELISADFGGQISGEAVHSEMLYLRDKGLVRNPTPDERPISPEIRSWTITAAGRDFWAVQSS